MAFDSPGFSPAPPTAVAVRWRLRDAELDLSVPRIMAICNVTPDSFSDGGKHHSVDSALRFAEAAIEDGASIVDVGGESTRPGNTPVSVATELARVVPVVESIRRRFPELLLSVDTVKSAVAEAVLSVGVHAINDVSAGRLDERMFAVVASARAGLVLMHSRGAVTEMATYALATYDDDPMAAVCAELGFQASAARAAGVPASAMVLDPGLGFSKTTAQSLSVLHHLERLSALGYPVLVGASRKRFVGEITGVASPAHRTVGSVVAHVLAVQRGARILRTHDVAATREALAVMAEFAVGGLESATR